MTPAEYCIACNNISGIGYTTFIAMIKHFGAIENIACRSAEEYMQISGIGQKTSRLLESTDFELAAAREINRAAARDVKIITIVDREYPEILKKTPSPPLVLYVAGKLPDRFEKSLGIVGSRVISNYAREQTSNLARHAALNGMTVISGMALGADTCAHRATVDAGGKTVAVIGAGLENIYPAENLKLAKDIISSGGALISELPMQFPVRATGFPRRNRIIAGISAGVLVTEASCKSGSMITADFARKYGRLLFALPGRVDNPNAAGCHKLIKNGAFLVENFSDIAEKYGIHTSHGNAADVKTAPAYQLTAAEEELLNTIKSGVCTFDLLVLKLNTHPGALTANLMSLELKNLIVQDGSQCYRIKQ